MAEQSTAVHPPGNYVSTIVDVAFSIFMRGMRGMRGVHRHYGEQHLHRYPAKFEFRYNNRIALGVTDTERSDTMLKGVVDKRLTYQTASARA